MNSLTNAHAHAHAHTHAHGKTQDFLTRLRDKITGSTKLHIGTNIRFSTNSFFRIKTMKAYPPDLKLICPELCPFTLKVLQWELSESALLFLRAQHDFENKAS